MKKRIIISVALIVTLIFSSCVTAFAATPQANYDITPQANMVTYYTLTPLVGSASDYTILYQTKTGNTILDQAIASAAISAICLALGEIPTIPALVANAAKLTSAATVISGVAQAKNINERKIFYTTEIYQYKSNGPHTFAYKYVTRFHNQAKTVTYSTHTEYYTYVI